MFFCQGVLRRLVFLDNLKPSYKKLGLRKHQLEICLFFQYRKNQVVRLVHHTNHCLKQPCVGLKFLTNQCTCASQSNRPQVTLNTINGVLLCSKCPFSFPFFLLGYMRCMATWLDLSSRRENVSRLRIKLPTTPFGFRYSPVSSKTFRSSQTINALCKEHTSTQ